MGIRKIGDDRWTPEPPTYWYHPPGQVCTPRPDLSSILSSVPSSVALAKEEALAKEAPSSIPPSPSEIPNLNSALCTPHSELPPGGPLPPPFEISNLKSQIPLPPAPSGNSVHSVDSVPESENATKAPPVSK
jgi:hypothetical protein